MRGLAEHHNLKAGDKFVVVGGNTGCRRISGKIVDAGTVFTADRVVDSGNIPYNKDYNINIRGDSNNCRVRLPYKNELKKG